MFLKTNLVSSSAVWKRESGTHSKSLPNAIQQETGQNLLFQLLIQWKCCDGKDPPAVLQPCSCSDGGSSVIEPPESQANGTGLLCLTLQPARRVSNATLLRVAPAVMVDCICQLYIPVV